MFLLITLSAIFVAYAFLKIFLRRAEKRRYREYKNASRVGSGTIGGTASIILFPIASIVLAIFEMFDYSIIALLIALAINVFQFGCEGLRVYYNDDELLFRRYYGKYRRVRFKNVTMFSVRKDLIIESNEKSIRIPSLLVDWDPILARLDARKASNLQSKRYTRVRFLKDAVSDLRRYYATLGVSFFLGCIATFMLILCINHTGEYQEIGIAVATFMAAFCYGSIPVSIIAVKRHHSSMFWDSVARALFAEIYLVPYVKNTEELKRYLNRGRNIVFTYNAKKYFIQPTGNESQALEKELVLMYGEKQLFKGMAEETINYEFEPGHSIKNSFKELDIIHIFKKLHWAIVLS